MELHITLAQYAVVQDGLLNIMGGGMRVYGPDPKPYFLAVEVGVSWAEANEVHRLTVDLLDEDGHGVVYADGSPAYQLEGEFEAAPMPGLRPGSELGMSMALPVPPLDLEPGRTYVWQFSVDGETRDGWSRAFQVRRRPGDVRMAS
jgi:hypothetical protein